MYFVQIGSILLAFCVQLSHVSTDLFQNIFKFCTFFPKFSNILRSFNISLPFSEILHPCPYLPEFALSDTDYKFLDIECD